MWLACTNGSPLFEEPYPVLVSLIAIAVGVLIGL